MRRHRGFAWLCLCALGAAQAADETSPVQHMEVVLQSPTADDVVVADLDLDDGGRYRLEYRDEPFTPHFLSMRPFQCLPAPPRLQCRLPYPYEKKRRITKMDLANLEYDLFFLVKQADEFGIDFWNGRYYRLNWEGNKIVGSALAADKNILASRPPAGVSRPIADSDLTEIAVTDTPYPSLLIRHARGKK